MDNLHSTLVAWLKVILPLTALAILSTLFLVARTIDPDDAIPFAQVDIEDRLREPRLTLPTWAGVTDDGAAVTVAAATARPGREAEGGAEATGAAARRLEVKVETPDGATTRLTAAEGRLDPGGRLLTVDGGVEIVTSTGYRMTTEAMAAALDRTRLESAGEVDADGPLGRLHAGRLVIRQSEAAPGDYVLHFTGGVKLIYGPPS